jgi:hypothetical protein
MNAVHYLTRLTRRVSLVEQELLILPEYLIMAIRKIIKGEKTIYKTLQKKLKIDQHHSTKNRG